MPLPLMLLPLLAMGVGVGGKYGLEYLAGEAEDERSSGMLKALRSARTAVPGSEIGPTGPELPEMRTDWGAVGEALLEAGDPAGLELAMKADMAKSSAASSAAASAEAHRREMEKLRYKEAEAWRRQSRTLAAQQAKDRAAREAGFMPTYHAPGSPGHFEILEEGTSLKYAGSILRDFSESLSTYGTEAWGERSGALASKRQQLMLYLKAAEGTGAIDEGTVRLFEEMLPDPTRLTPDALNEESGKLAALVDLFNSKYIPEYQARAMYTSDVPTIGAIMSEEVVPEGLVPVDEGMMQREREMQQNLVREQRERAGAGVSYAPQREIEEGLDALQRRFAR